MREIKFRVWCEFTIDGEKHCEMAGPENWFLLTQTGHLMLHGPMSYDPNAEQKYDKLIVEFYTGLKDKKRTAKYLKGQDIYEGDTLLVTSAVWSCTDELLIVVWLDTGYWGVTRKDGSNFPTCLAGIMGSPKLEIIGNIHEGD